MNIRSISNDGLKQIVAQWLEDPDHVAIIGKDPLLSANVDHLHEARKAFAELLPTPALDAATEARIATALKQLGDEITEADAAFDDPTRAIFALCDAAAATTDDDAFITQLIRARERVFPRGLSIVNLTPAEEAGVAISESEALDADSKETFGSIELRVRKQKTTVLALVQQQIAAGKKLGKLVAKRDKLYAERDAAIAEASAHDERSALARFGEARAQVTQAIANFVRDVQRARKLNAEQKAVLLATVTKLSSLGKGKGKAGGESEPAT